MKEKIIKPGMDGKQMKAIASKVSRVKTPKIKKQANFARNFGR